MADKDLKITLSADDKLSPVVQKAVENVGGLNTGLVNLHAGLGAAKIVADVAAQAFQFMSNAIERGIHEALEGEKANNRLTGALVQTGNYTKELNQALNEHVDILELTVGADGEVAKGMMATGLQMGLSIQKTKELEQASRQLAAANGITVQEAFSTLQQTLAGQSRALGKLIPDVKELGSAQLKQGEAIDIVLEKTQAQYALYQNSLPAALDKSNVATGNLYKAIGNIITQNPDVKKAVESTAKAFNDLTAYIEKNSATWSSYLSTVINAASSFNALGWSVEEFHKRQVESSGALGTLTKMTKEGTLADLDAANAKSKLAALTQAHYGEIVTGTLAQRNALKAEVEDRSSNLKDFTDFLAAKKRLAISAALEQQIEEGKITAGALKGSGGSAEGGANASAAVLAEKKKQKDLKVEWDNHLINLEQYNQAMFASGERAAHAEIDQANAKGLAIATALGNTEEAFAIKQATAQQHFELGLAYSQTRAMQEGAETDQINAAKTQKEAEHLALMSDQKEKYYTDQAAMHTRLGNSFEAYLDRVKAAQVKQGEVMGALTVTTQSAQYKATQQGFNNLSALTNTRSRALFEIGKAAQVAGAVMNVASAATAALAPPPLGVGPLLGPILAGTAIAAGAVQIAHISAQEYPAGQAHEGNDYIPESLSGKSFVVSGGERIIQPEANKDLTKFLNGGAKGGSSPVYNITLNYNGSGGKQDGENMAAQVMKEIRRQSELGVALISSKAVY